MNGGTVARHRTSFGVEACRLTMILYILAIFRGVFSAFIFWGFWAIAMIFWLSERYSPYFRGQLAQLTVLTAAEAIVCRLLAIPVRIETFRWCAEYLPNYLAMAENAGPEGVGRLVMLLMSTDIGGGVFSALCSTMSSLVSCLVTVLLIIGAVRAGQASDWRIPGAYSLAGWLDGRLHRGARTF